MLTKIGNPVPPKGLRLKFFRAPITLYHMKLGFLMGSRFLRLKHLGRISGTWKETVIEVIDQDMGAGKVYSASGFGEQSQWYKNVVANPHVKVTLKTTEYDATARVLSESEAEQVLLKYAKAHPRSMQAVAKLSGYAMDGSDADVIAFSKIVRILEFTLQRE